MGYSARYHATSLIAVFLALAVGILIGAEFGGEVISSTREGLEESLQDNLEESREEIDELEASLERSREFGGRVYPALVGDRLAGSSLGVVSFGEPSDETVQQIGEALEPAGAEVVALAVVRQPPRLGSLADALEGTPFASVEREPELLASLGSLVGDQLVGGGSAFDRLSGEIFSRLSGSFGSLDGVIVMRSRPDEPEGEEAEQEAERTELVADGLLRGLADSDAVVVGVESTDVEESSADYLDARGIASVDNIDQVSGQLSLVMALLGAQGKFGVKESADSLMPDVLTGLGGARVGDLEPGTPGTGEASGGP